MNSTVLNIDDSLSINYIDYILKRFYTTRSVFPSPSRPTRSMRGSRSLSGSYWSGTIENGFPSTMKIPMESYVSFSLFPVSLPLFLCLSLFPFPVSYAFSLFPFRVSLPLFPCHIFPFSFRFAIAIRLLPFAFFSFPFSPSPFPLISRGL